ncbi:MAG: aminotransferase class V-fold PLP-dependent enzyme, partial [Acholeplasma sp.]|nr:aminotransferase class V-fold PLP-dependent enzyme [Acholeplasma sp.]
MNKYIKTRFPFFSTNEGTTYLDSAASSLKLGSVTNALNEYYQASGVNIHRGVYKLAYEATEKYEETRKLVSDFLNSEVDEVIFTKGTTDSLNK